MPTLTILGGSSVAVPELIAALEPYLFSSPGGDRALRLVLHGRDAQKLALVEGVCRGMAAGIPGLDVSATTDLPGALRGADMVLNQVRVGGLNGRAYDETFPHCWNIPGEETIGPGGAANAFRTVPVVLDLCRAIEQYAADCTLLTFSNPSSVVQRAVMQKTTLKVVGLCDAPATMHRLVARALGQLPDHVDTQYVGMHHFGWITSALVDGVERLEEALSDSAIWAALGIDPAIGSLIGALPHPYFRYFFYPHHMLAKQRSAAQPRAHDLQRLEAQLLAEYAEYAGRGRPESLSRRSAVWYEAVVAPVVAALAFGVPARLALNLRNDGRVGELANDTVIEISARIEGGVIGAPRPRRLPSSAQLGLLQANAAYERALVEAILDDSRERLLEALLIHPLVPSFDAAREIVDELWPRRGWPKETAS